MSVAEQIKAATANLGPDEQYELFRWWVGSASFQRRQLATLKQDIAVGIGDLESGRYQHYAAANVMQLAEEVCRGGRVQLSKKRNSKAT